MLRRHVLSVAACAAFAASILFGAADAPAFAQGAPLQKIRINKIPISLFVPAELAISRGWFKEEGLDVTIETVAPGGIAMQGLLAGKLDVIYTGLDSPLKARAQGFDVVLISNNNNAPPKPPNAAMLIVRKDGGPKTMKELEGKRVAVASLQNVDWAYTRESIAKGGGDPNKVQFLEVPFPQMLDAVLSGHVEAAAAVEPFGTIGKNTGKIEVIGYRFTDVQPRLNIAGWAAQGRWVKENPKAVAGFRRALQRAMDFMNESVEERNKAILQFTTLKAELVNSMVYDDWTTKLDPADLAKQLEVYKRNGMIDKVYDVKAVIAP